MRDRPRRSSQAPAFLVLRSLSSFIVLAHLSNRPTEGEGKSNQVWLASASERDLRYGHYRAVYMQTSSSRATAIARLRTVHLSDAIRLPADWQGFCTVRHIALGQEEAALR